MSYESPVPELQVLMTVSSGHLPHEEYLRLESKEAVDQAPFFIYEDRVFGAVIVRPVADLEENLERQCAAAGFPSLGKLLSIARTRGAGYVQLDGDGPRLPGLAHYEW